MSFLSCTRSIYQFLSGFRPVKFIMYLLKIYLAISRYYVMMRFMTSGHDNNVTKTGECQMSDEEQEIEFKTMNAKEFMELLDLSPNTFEKNLRAGKLPPPLPMVGRSRRWAIHSVKNYLNNMITKPNL